MYLLKIKMPLSVMVVLFLSCSKTIASINIKELKAIDSNNCLNNCSVKLVTQTINSTLFYCFSKNPVHISNNVINFTFTKQQYCELTK